MTFRGTVRNGIIEIDGKADLQEGEAVEIQRIPKETLLDVFLRHQIKDDSLPKDYAAEIDHYLYGHPKRNSGRKASARRSSSAKKKARKTVKKRSTKKPR